ncbi:MAG: iron-containing alcohol dehydrogenase, partial [Theionarchaea archaeon]|nr:iron-containing alcohol dehydrogenase [Theionarchaea archaeon]
MKVEKLVGNWNYPTKIRFGAGRIDELPDACAEIGITRPLLVTDPDLAGMNMIEQSLENCRRSGIDCGIFSDIKPNPTGDSIERGVKIFREAKHDGVIAFGGGSSMDAGKAIAFMSGQKLPLWEFEDLGDNWRKANPGGIAPTVAVPTTSGTGSEVGRAAVLTDSELLAKRIIFHPRMLPSMVIADPALTVGLPPRLTAATGMDALAHNLEAFCAPTYHPMAEGIALEGIRLVKNWLPQACREGSDMVARSQMMAASTMGATSFQRGLGAMHALAHPIGAIYDAHHGLVNAVLMPYVLEANRVAIDSLMERLGRYLDLTEACFDGMLKWVLELREEIGIPHALSELGIDENEIGNIVRMAIEDPSSNTNPIQFRVEDY